LVNNRL